MSTLKLHYHLNLSGGKQLTGETQKLKQSITMAYPIAYAVTPSIQRVYICDSNCIWHAEMTFYGHPSYLEGGKAAYPDKSHTSCAFSVCVLFITCVY